MKRTFILFFILIIFTPSLTGCWSSREINEISIASALGIDKSDEGYLVTVQLINPGEIAAQATSTRTPVTTYRTSGESILEAMRKLTLETPRKIYLSHLRLLVFGEDFAKDGIGKSLDFLSRDHEMRADYYIAVAKNVTAGELLDVLTPVEKIPANKIFSSLEMSTQSWASTYDVQLDELISSLISDGSNPVLTGIIIKGDSNVGNDVRNVEKVDSPTTIQLRYIAGFKKDKLVGWLSEEESIGYNYIMDHITSTIVTVPWPEDGKVSIELIRTNASIKGIVEDGQPKIDIEVWAEGNVGDVQSKVDLSKTENIYSLEKVVGEKIKSQMEAAIKRAQEDFESDIFGFGDVIHRVDPNLWKELKDNWDKEFKKLEVNIKVNAKIRRLGTITESFQKEIRE
ncbi:Ger(x)C family spore germination protein [Wukongibacter baidiensis]|uniref:Ger(x)C family spore germination protein n=1 Tax=Wukongibacter baidiensis TaxID=1723361 RepID=UPI003D7FF503